MDRKRRQTGRRNTEVRPARVCVTVPGSSTTVRSPAGGPDACGPAMVASASDSTAGTVCCPGDSSGESSLSGAGVGVVDSGSGWLVMATDSQIRLSDVHTARITDLIVGAEFEEREPCWIPWLPAPLSLHSLHVTPKPCRVHRQLLRRHPDHHSRSLLAQFGLTPKSRRGLAVGTVGDVVDPLDGINYTEQHATEII